MAAKEIGKLTISSFFNPVNLALIAGVYAAKQLAYASLEALGLEEGGVVLPKSGGTSTSVSGRSAVVGEGGQAEAVIPLNQFNTREKPPKIVVQIDGKTIAEAVGRYAPNVNRRGRT